MTARKSHGDGRFPPEAFARFGAGAVVETTALCFHPEHISLGDRVYVAHYAILNGYHDGALHIGDGSWIGPHCFLHGAGGLTLGREVGVGPGVKILTSHHGAPPDPAAAIMSGRLVFAPVSIGDGSDLGAGCVVLPGVAIGAGVQVGAGAVVTGDLPDRAVAVGVPARVVRTR